MAGKTRKRLTGTEGSEPPCAVVLGCPPSVSYTAVQKVPEIHDELAVTGGPVEVSYSGPDEWRLRTSEDAVREAAHSCPEQAIIIE